MAYVLGIDGGGTKTDFALADASGKILARARVGGSSLARRPQDEVFGELERGLRALGPKAAVAATLCGGFASAGINAPVYKSMLRDLMPHARVKAAMDAEIAWRGAFGGQDGIVVVAGTGSIAWGRYRGRTARAGGTKPGRDPGSGDWIAATGAGPDETARALMAMANECAAKLGWREPSCSYAGGVFEHWPDVLAAMPHLRPPQATPIDGAVAMAREMLGC